MADYLVVGLSACGLCRASHAGILTTHSWGLLAYLLTTLRRAA